jgi:hypothetical protein
MRKISFGFDGLLPGFPDDLRTQDVPGQGSRQNDRLSTFHHFISIAAYSNRQRDPKWNDIAYSPTQRRIWAVSLAYGAIGHMWQFHAKHQE